ncbi:MAG TPA: hypothetical protein DCZ72_13460, partial [Armatimonadetes bacterium]|nr:hypothetical protein [Armatimonadota bacterium]
MASRLLRRVTTEDNLWAAWRQVKAAGAGPGLDGRGLEFYANEPERLLDRLQHELRAGRYEPWPLRRAWVPKRGGRWRAVGVGTVRDRVAQRAVLHLLAPRAEEIFNETSFAYRAGRGVRQAVASIDRARRDGLVEVFETDIADCFDSLDHELLRAAIRGLVPESDVRALCWAWLRAGVVTNGQLVRPRRGVAQGDLLSPLWCNLYLDPFDDSAEGRSGQLVRYADDLLYLTRTPAGAEAAQAHVTRELERLRLRLNPDKTRLTSFEEGFEYLGLEFHGSLITDLTWRPAVRGRP